jgi:prepilin-type N-terminal cleavage/methylation domain-containing protein
MRNNDLITRRAWSLIELVVVLAIIAVLTALVLAAVHKAREAASRAACANHLKQISLALLQHHDAYGVFPGNGGWDGQQWIYDINGQPTYVYTDDYFLPNYWYWGVGDPNRTPQDQTGSWAFAILPFLEQQGMHQQPDWTKAVKCYHCPRRRSAVPQVPVNDDRGAYNGGGWPWGKIDYAANSRVIPNRPLEGKTRCLRLADLTDGTSETIFVGEKVMDVNYYTTGTWWWDEPFLLGGSDSTSRKGTAVVQDAPGIALRSRENWGSAHSAGAEISFADGSVRILRYDTPSDVVLALLTPSGQEVIPDF